MIARIPSALEKSMVTAITVCDKVSGFGSFGGFTMGEPDLPWRKFVDALQSGGAHGDSENALRFVPP